MERIYHPIIHAPHLYEIVFFSYKHKPKDIQQSHIELHLEKEGVVKKLRFMSPRDLEIEKGFPYTTVGMFIEDVSSHQLDGINIYVGDFEASNGQVTFWAEIQTTPQ